MNEAVIRAIGLPVTPCDLVILVTKDGLSEEDLEALDPLMQQISNGLKCSMLAFPESVMLDMKVLALPQLLSLRDSIDEAISSKMSTTNTPTA